MVHIPKPTKSVAERLADQRANQETIAERLARQRREQETVAERLARQRREQRGIQEGEADFFGRGGPTAPTIRDDSGDRSGNTQASRILNMRLFRLPDGTWITPRNMAEVLAKLRKGGTDQDGNRLLGYRGPWFPTIPADVPAFMQSDQFIKVFRGLTAFLATGQPPGSKTPPVVFDPTGFGDPAGGGFGSIGPVYQAPDEAAVKEALQGFQVAVTGQLDDPLLDKAVAEYLTTHKQDFDDKNVQHDPFQAAKTIIRSSESYKDIHKLRKESVDELSWVTTQQGRLRTLGLTSEQSEQLGIKLARVGASQEAAEDAGNTAFFKSTGRVAKDQRDSLKASARSVLGLL